ncbi:MAG: hypothetical protein R3B40_17905 [Polyangiales bacterium]|nr:hypothetical protein [Sandaracinaceae bacterium]
MSFWEDLSTPVKGALVVGVVGIIGAILMWGGVFDSEPEGGTTQERGFHAETASE